MPLPTGTTSTQKSPLSTSRSSGSYATQGVRKNGHGKSPESIQQSLRAVMKDNQAATDNKDGHLHNAPKNGARKQKTNGRKPSTRVNSPGGFLTPLQPQKWPMNEATHRRSDSLRMFVAGNKAADTQEQKLSKTASTLNRRPPLKTLP